MFVTLIASFWLYRYHYHHYHFSNPHIHDYHHSHYLLDHLFPIVLIIIIYYLHVVNYMINKIFSLRFFLFCFVFYLLFFFFLSSSCSRLILSCLSLSSLLLSSSSSLSVVSSGLGLEASAPSCCLDYFEHNRCTVSIART